MKATALILALALAGGQAMAHSGGTIRDESPGCHTGSPGSAQPGYHCHGESESKIDPVLLLAGLALVILLWEWPDPEDYGLSFTGQSDGTSSDVTVTKEWRW